MGEAENKAIEEEKVALTKQLESERGNLSQYQERQAKAAGMKADMENQLDAAQKQLVNEEIKRQEMTGDKKKMEGEIGIVKKDIEDLQVAEEKVSHLTSIKSKLESTLDELEDGAN